MRVSYCTIHVSEVPIHRAASKHLHNSEQELNALKAYSITIYVMKAERLMFRIYSIITGNRRKPYVNDYCLLVIQT